MQADIIRFLCARLAVVCGALLLFWLELRWQRIYFVNSIAPRLHLGVVHAPAIPLLLTRSC